MWQNLQHLKYARPLDWQDKKVCLSADSDIHVSNYHQLISKFDDLRSGAALRLVLHSYNWCVLCEIRKSESVMPLFSHPDGLYWGLKITATTCESTCSFNSSLVMNRGTCTLNQRTRLCT